MTDNPKNAIYIDGKVVHSNTPPQPPKKRKVWRPPGNLDPTILPGPKLKIKRAIKHLDDLHAALMAFKESGPHELICDKDEKTGENVYRVHVKKALPCELPTIIGDIVHNLRAALDHLICDLVRAAKKQPRRSTGFPISGTRKHFETGSIGKIEGVSPKARRFIERLKPYKGGNTPLWILHELDALDKHSGIIPVAAASVNIFARWANPVVFMNADRTKLYIGGPGPDGEPVWTGFGTPQGAKPVFPLEDNSEVYRSPPSGVPEEVQVRVEVAFGKSEIIQGEPIFETLHQLTVFVDRTLAIVEKYVI
ncbi:MAG: hypothetical protein JF595_12420 [Sphingomonadales bacterium]|nr:hypothetical protein [Sphingomonadales bacterium]